jgi:hypothetical protein
MAPGRARRYDRHERAPPARSTPPTLSALLLSLLALLSGGPPGATGHVAADEVVIVEGMGPVALAGLECIAIGRSSAVGRVCRDATGTRAVAQVGGRTLAYCDLPEGLVAAWLDARSMGRFHAEHLAGRHACG